MIGKLKNSHILLVEDDLISRLVVQKDLESKGFENIHGAKNSKETLAYLESQPIKLVLMDIRLADGDNGIELSKKIVTKFKIPIIFVTASTDPATLDEALALKPFGIINKPIDYQQLFNVVATTLNRTLEVNTEKLEPDDILSLIYDTARIGMCVTDDTGAFVRVNKAYCETYRYNEDYLIGKNFTTVLPEDQRAYAQKMHDDFIYENIKELPAEWNVLTSEAEMKDIYVTAGRLRSNGNIFKITTVTDITERNRYLQQLKNSVEERKILVKEIYHRVKNNLNLISNLFYLQLHSMDKENEAAAILQSGISRIRSLAILHEKLYKNEDLQSIEIHDYLESLKSVIVEGFNQNVESDFDNFTTNIDVAIALGLIMNELVTNAVKHSFVDQDSKNKIVISLKHNGNRSYRFSVGDNGKPLPADFKPIGSNTLGMQVIHSLSEQLNGTFNFQQENGMKEFYVDFQLREILNS